MILFAEPASVVACPRLSSIDPKPAIRAAGTVNCSRSPAPKDQTDELGEHVAGVVEGEGLIEIACENVVS